jgi:hypothetical protein
MVCPPFCVPAYRDQRTLETTGLGSVRTATKRAGGTVRNHGHSPGKRLGVKKFSGTCFDTLQLQLAT